MITKGDLGKCVWSLIERMKEGHLEEFMVLQERGTATYCLGRTGSPVMQGLFEDTKTFRVVLAVSSDELMLIVGMPVMMIFPEAADAVP